MEIKYIHQEDIHNTESAQIILPIVKEYINANSVLDLGCGIGTWLSVVKNLGIPEVLGVDGDYVDRSLLAKYLSVDEFISHNLDKSLDLGRRFDLSLCLEVAEHLQESSAGTLVQTLVRHSDLILFSAAIPGQGGQNHLNEQFPSYWRDKFNKMGYVFLDIIRPKIWDNSEIDYWYRQNIFLVVKKEHQLAQRFPESYPTMIHPFLWEQKLINHQRNIDRIELQLAVHPLRRWLKGILKGNW